MADASSASVQAWLPAVQQLAGDMPGRAVDRILQWMAIESGGNECSLDASRTTELSQGWVPDAGVLQIFFASQNSVVSGATSASLRQYNCTGISQSQTRALTAAEMVTVLTPQIAWLRGAIVDAQSQLDAVGASWSERDQWRWYKFVEHGLPAFAKCVLWTTTSVLGSAPPDWDTMKATFQNSVTSDTIAQGAADPSNNGCTWLAANINNTALQNMAWHNAEEMDLMDELSPTDQISRVVGDLLNPSASDTPLSLTEMIFIGAAAIAGVVGATYLTRWLTRGAGEAA
jgi:hypothetical protein